MRIHEVMDPLLVKDRNATVGSERICSEFHQQNFTSVLRHAGRRLPRGPGLRRLRAPQRMRERDVRMRGRLLLLEEERRLHQA